jgi:hypothetical protein
MKILAHIPKNNYGKNGTYNYSYEYWANINQLTSLGGPTLYGKPKILPLREPNLHGSSDRGSSQLAMFFFAPSSLPQMAPGLKFTEVELLSILLR